jgi:malonyl-CoA/methylmalonyl-CoA synthetase
VVLALGASLDEQPVRDAFTQRLAKYKLPRHEIFAADLPRNAMGKVHKNLSRETFGELFARAGNCP